MRPIQTPGAGDRSGRANRPGARSYDDRPPRLARGILGDGRENRCCPIRMTMSLLDRDRSRGPIHPITGSPDHRIVGGSGLRV